MNSQVNYITNILWLLTAIVSFGFDFIFIGLVCASIFFWRTIYPFFF